jgi:hypothetical protein
MFVPPPAQVQAAPAPTRPLHALLEALEALPEAITDHRPGRVARDAAPATRLWARCQGAAMGSFGSLALAASAR